MTPEDLLMNLAARVKGIGVPMSGAALSRIIVQMVRDLQPADEEPIKEVQLP